MSRAHETSLFWFETKSNLERNRRWSSSWQCLILVSPWSFFRWKSRISTPGTERSMWIDRYKFQLIFLGSTDSTRLTTPLATVSMPWSIALTLWDKKMWVNESNSNIGMTPIFDSESAPTCHRSRHDKFPGFTPRHHLHGVVPTQEPVRLLFFGLGQVQGRGLHGEVDESWHSRLVTLSSNFRMNFLK